jgi:two-component system response regulator AtoC
MEDEMKNMENLPVVDDDPCYLLTGNSNPMSRIRSQICAVAETSSMAVVIEGETGTGKGHLARVIHLKSKSSGEFVHVDCANLNDELFASEMFGHARGAFTGAHCRTDGMLLAASNGTLFLDEISCMSKNLQSRLLVMLDGSGVRRLGETVAVNPSFRLIVSSREPLLRLKEDGMLRSDLFFRLNHFCIQMPNLRDRKEDIPLLMNKFLADWKTSLKAYSPVEGFTDEAMDLAMEYEWPGNVRELKYAVETAAFQARMNTCKHIDDGDLAARLVMSGARMILAGIVKPLKQTDRQRLEEAPPAASLEPGPTLAEAEEKYILDALSRNGGRIAETARELGISDRNLRRKIKELKLKYEVENWRDILKRRQG